MNRYAVWFRWVVVLGILVNMFFSLPGMFIPNTVLQISGEDPVREPVWPGAASLLLTLLSLFYIPAAVNLFRYTPVAWLAILSRFAGFTFFILLWKHNAIIAWVDLCFGVPELILLILALRRGPDPDY